MQRTSRRGFTLAELLVVIAIIAIIASLIMGGLPGARERSRRASCVSSLRQFSLTCHLYAGDSADWLPSGVSDLGVAEVNDQSKAFLTSGQAGANLDEHIPVLSTEMWNHLRQAAGSERPMMCPSLGGGFASREGLKLPGYGVIIGYNYLGGHLKTPWNPTVFVSNIWTSPQKLSSDPSLLLATDLNVFSVTEGTCFVPHTRHGPEMVGKWAGLKTTLPAPKTINGPADLHPARFGAAGGNVAGLDGSVNWRGIGKMKPRIGSSNFGDEGALAIW